jgi:RimJ/RimL family protein N-acetyltransferase
MPNMPKEIPSIELLVTKQIEQFIPVLREVELGDRFLLAMLHWCEIGQRSTPLDLWHVFLVQHTGETVGVTGLYRQPGMSKDVGWIGWFGIRPRFRRQGYGTRAIKRLTAIAREVACKELWVYTGSADKVAIEFYQRLGFAVVGFARECARGQTMDDSDVVLKRAIQSSD